MALLEKACRENWSCSDARDKLKASRGVDALVRTGGRKHRPPRSLPIALARWQREADDLIRHAATVFRPEVIAKLLKSPEATSVTAERVLDVRRTVERTLAAILAELQMLDRITAGLPGLVSAIPPSDPPPVSDPKVGPDEPKPGRAGRRSRGSTG